MTWISGIPEILLWMEFGGFFSTPLEWSYQISSDLFADAREIAKLLFLVKFEILTVSNSWNNWWKNNFVQLTRSLWNILFRVKIDIIAASIVLTVVTGTVHTICCILINVLWPCRVFCSKKINVIFTPPRITLFYLIIRRETAKQREIRKSNLLLIVINVKFGVEHSSDVGQNEVRLI